MRVIMFQPQFADKVKAGEKRQTIRKTARCNKGDCLSLRRWKDKPYRSKHEVLKTAECVQVHEVVIDWRGVFVNGYPMPHDGLDKLAKADGFEDFKAMCEWFESTHSLPFGGYIIEW